MSSVSRQARSANAATSAKATPLLSAKHLPEAMSLTNTPGKVCGADVSTAEDAVGRSSACRISPISPYRISSEAYTSSHRTGSRQLSSSSEAQVRVTPGVVHEIDIMSTARYGKDFPAEFDTPTAKLRVQKPSEPLAVTLFAPPPAVPERPVLPSPPHAAKEPQTQTARASGVKSDSNGAPSALSPFDPLGKDFAKPPSDLLSLRTPSILPQESHAPPSEQSSATHPTRAGAPKVARNLDQRDMSSVARSNAHLSVLADLVDKKVFSEEDVLLELEAVRKRSLLTSAPFNKRLLPILAWYLLRDKFGDEAATRYVSLLTSPAGATHPDGAVSTTSTIASFLPRVNEIRRVRREVKESNRKKPKHHYAINPPASPTEAAKLSDIEGAHGKRRQLRRTAAFDALEDASDIPTTGLPSPQSRSTLSSTGVRNRSPLTYGRLHVYTREHAIIDRRDAKAEDRPVVDVVMDAANRQDRAKNVFEVVEEQASSVVEEPSVFEGPGHKPPRTKSTASKSTSKERVPAPPASAHAACALGEATARSCHGLQVHGSDACAMLDVTPSIGVFSEVRRANESEEGLSLFYRECVGGADQERIPSVSAFWKAITSPDTPAARTAPSRQCLPARHPQHGHVDFSGGPADVMGAVTPCVSNIFALTDYGASAQSSGLAGETVGSSDLSTVANNTTSARSSVEYLHGLGGDHERYDGEASAVPEENPASQTLASTVAYSALNDPHESRVGAGDTENTTDAAYCLATSFLLRDGGAAEAADTSKQRLYAGLSSAENPTSRTVMATEYYYSTLPNASTATHRPEYSQRSRSEVSWETSSATMPNMTETFQEEGAAGKETSYGSLIKSRIDTAAMSSADSIKTREDTDTGLHTVAEYSAFAHSEALAMGPRDASGVQSPTISTHGTLRRDTSAAAAAPFSMLKASSDTTDRTGQSAHRVCGAATVSKSRFLDSGVHSSRSGGCKTSFSDPPATESPHDGTPAHSMFDSRTDTCLSPPSTTIDGSSYAPSAPSGESAFGSLLLTNAKTSTMDGGDHRQGHPIEPFHSIAVSDASANTYSALQRDNSANAGHCCASRNTCWAHVAEHSANGGVQFATPLRDSASPPPAAVATGSRTASTHQRFSSGAATGRRSLSDALAAHLEDASVMHNQRTDDGHSAQSADARDTQSPITAISATSPPSRAGTHHDSVRSRGGYGSLMEADSAVTPDASAASRSNGGYSLGGRSEASVQSRGGYGSLMEADSAVTPDASAASRSNGGYSLGGRSEASVQSRGGYGSLMEADSAVTPDASAASRSNGGYSLGGRSEASVQSRGGYGSLMEADSAVTPDASAASRSDGGYSLADGGRCRCPTDPSALSASTERSLKARKSGGWTMNCSDEQVGGRLANRGFGGCAPAAPESVSVERRAFRVESSRGGDAVASHTTALPVSEAVGDGCSSGLQPRSPMGPAVNPSRLTPSTKEETAASTYTAFSGCEREGATLSSSMDPDELADALQRLGERHVSWLKENNACTFGELGCQCATGKCQVCTTVATLPPPRRPQPVPPSDEESRAQRFDRVAMRSGSPEKAPGCESPNPPPPAAVPVEEKSWNTAVPLQSLQRKNRVSSAGVSSRSNATLVRVGAGFNLRTSPSPARGAEEVSTRQATQQVSIISELDAVTAAPTKSTPPGRCKDSDASRTESFLEGDGLRSQVTILTCPRSSTDLTVHNMPDAAIERADASIQQLREHQRTGFNFSGYSHADCLMMTPVSILQSSPGSSRIHDPKTVGVSTRPQAAAVAPSAVSVPGDRTAYGALTAGDSAVTRSVIPFPLPPEASVVNPTVCALGDELLRTPHNMTTVLLGGDRQSGRFSITQAAREEASGSDDAEAVHEAEFTREVDAKHRNLATLLCHSRLDASGVTTAHSHVLESSAAATRTRLVNGDRSRSVGVLLSEQTEMDASGVDKTRVDSNGESRETAPPAGSDVDESWISVDPSTTQNTQLAVSVPGRRFVHCPPMHPYNGVRADHDSPEQREQHQGRRTILDVPGVPYVDSPDISTSIDKEARQKEKDRQLFAMRWAERGLMWQRQENEAQRYEESQAHFGAGKEQPRGPRLMIMKPGRQGAVALPRPRLPNVPRPPMPMHPRSPGYPPRRRHS
ncbi:hypothetical protein LMJF_31_2220 [Leishmania major strain Friedlin]|uniref:Uncharacterized protein n=1 Tax=Leishmania major TaxID=5664 RepID=Q4Q639_LEIMA|nr:hypothetical protein LMJF_31_2220 [Leishmania major strain Friedlin]CAG9579399.1 hypothetical_protein_-_conserved [Leishmania major strain Friedlin]CAJ08411.1 hypothetical protein LMJF_31_2220 [Leishmania major strain Friedlin]|eukprot:XP_001685209.1 hypothetical protein LMJF_31_2220 [Leishmania major strain Friedlin]